MSPRRRIRGREWMPPKVQYSNGSYNRIYGTGPDRTSVSIYYDKTPPEKASRRTKTAVLNAYKQAGPTRQGNSVNHLLGLYMKSDAWAKLAPKTRSGYEYAAIKIRQLLGNMNADTLTRGQLRQYMDSRADIPGNANKEITLIKGAYSWAFERDLVSQNPARDIKKFPSRAGTRYVTDDEFHSFCEFAPPIWKAFAWMGYVTALRRGDLVRLKKSAITDDGLLVYTSKTKQLLLFEWTDDLRYAIQLCKDVPRSVHIYRYLLGQRNGTRYADNGLGSRWRLIQQDWSKATGHQTFAFRDLRAKSATDHSTGEHLGHRRTDVLQRHYRNRLPKRVQPVEVKR